MTPSLGKRNIYSLTTGTYQVIPPHSEFIEPQVAKNCFINRVELKRGKGRPSRVYIKQLLLSRLSMGMNYFHNFKSKNMLT